MEPSVSTNLPPVEIRVPGPRGPFEAYRWMKEYDRDPFGFFLRIREEYGDVVKIWNPGPLLVNIYDPDLVEYVLVRNARNYIKDAYLRQWKDTFGDGLLSAEGEAWKRERRLVQPAFQRDRIHEYAAPMSALGDEMLRSWKSGETRAVNVDMMALTLRIVVKTLFGADLAPGVEARVKAAFDECSRFFVVSGEPMGYWLCRLPIPARRRYLAAVRELHGIIGAIIEKRSGAQEGGLDLLGGLLASRDEDGSRLTGRQLLDELMTFFLAGHETTALALTYTLHFLAKNPELQEGARADQELLHRVIQESMRLYPPAWMLAREAVSDDRLGRYAIRKGTNVVIPTWAIHRDPRFYPEPEKFLPGRWTPEFQKALPRAAYLPFGFGARMCIGYQFAMMEIELLLAQALERFRFSAADDQPLSFEPSITMRPLRDVRLRVEARS